MKYCLGTVQFGLNYGVQKNGKPKKELVNRILDAAFNNGVDTFDTAFAYGDSELVLGEYFANNRFNAIKAKVITKISSDEVFNDENVNKSEILLGFIDKSLHNLKINRLYGLMYHDSKVVNISDRMNTLIETKSKSLVDKVGVSVYTSNEALKAIDYDIDMIQVPYNLFDNRLNKVDFFRKAKSKGIEIYARSSLLQGLALMDYSALPENIIFAKKYLKLFNELCKKYSIDRLNAAVNYVSLNKYIDYIVFGTDNLEQFNEYLATRDCVLPRGFIEEIKIAFDNVPEKLVNPVLWK